MSPFNLEWLYFFKDVTMPRQLPCLVILSVTAAGCSLTPIKPPAIDKDQPPKAVVLTRYPEGGYEKRFTLYRVPNSYFGISYANSSHDITSRYGAVAGIIAIKAAEAESKKIGETIGDIVSINLAELLKASDSKLSIAQNKKLGVYSLIPAASLLFWNGTRFSYSCQVTVEYSDKNAEMWKAYYVVEKYTSDYFDASDPAQKGMFITSLSGCLAEARNIFYEHATEKLGNVTKRRLKRDGFEQSLLVYENPLPERAIHSSGDHLIQFSKGFELLAD